MTDHRTELARHVRDIAYRHIDGVAIGSTVAALSERGVLDNLAARGRVAFDELRREAGARPGFLRVAIRLLADQGWVRLRGGPDAEDLVVETTVSGAVVFAQLARAYRLAVEFLPVAERLDSVLRVDCGTDVLGHWVGLMRREWDLPARREPADVRRQVLTHLNGHLIAPLVHAMTGAGMLRAGADLALENRAMAQAAGILAWQGWAQISGNTAWLTPEGEIAVAYARQYRYPVVYLPMLRRVPDLLFGEGDVVPMADAHLDRGLDVRFSGDVFTATCRRPFLGMTLPIFDQVPVAEQPAFVVDTGCGDGTVLATLHTAVCAATARGRAGSEHPLLMVGVDPSPVARRATAARLTAAGAPHLVLDGDIAEPERLERDLAAHGLDARNALHISKSAIHDRAFGCPPPAPSAATGEPPVSYSAFAATDGSDVPAGLVARSLAELMTRWRPLIRRHGWLVIEAHATPAVVAARLMGQTMSTAFDATHGYSCQYPVEPRVYGWAARAAGLSSRKHAAPGATQVGHTVLTVDHFVVDGPD